jgi:hypothetical protein
LGGAASVEARRAKIGLPVLPVHVMEKIEKKKTKAVTSTYWGDKKPWAIAIFLSVTRSYQLYYLGKT